jgi:putative ABC transport system ATP-binding protein
MRTAARSNESVAALSGVRFSWTERSPPILRIDSLDLRRGERAFVRGASGSGKSTLLNLLAGVLTPREGSVRVLGRDLAALPGAARDRLRADHVGYIFQMFNLIPYLSVIENVWLPCRFSATRRARALSQSGSLEREALRLLRPLEMDDADVLRRPVNALSVGQQQRVAVARALIGAPELVLADEPTSSLDADRQGAFLELLFRQCGRERTTIVFASHDSSLAQLFDRTIELFPFNPESGSTAAAGEERA